MDKNERRARHLGVTPFTKRRPNVRDMREGDCVEYVVNGVKRIYTKRNGRLHYVEYTEE